MECNKDEAYRAKEIAEGLLRSNDFSRALKAAQRAQRLFPDVENITQLLTVCEIHCSAEKRFGTEQDWYGILQIEKSADDNTIKKQYRKMALLLHPDKNKFVGSEAAFKLINEAYRILGDRAKRSLYDIKVRSSTVVNIVRQKKPPPPPSKVNVSSVKRDGPSRNFGNASKSQFTDPIGVKKEPTGTFWTMCPCCQVKYEYYRKHLEKTMRCQNCKTPFNAYECSRGTQDAGNTERGPVSGMNASNGDPVKVNFQKNTQNHPYPVPKDGFGDFPSKCKGTAGEGGSSETQQNAGGISNEGTKKDGRGKVPLANATRVEDTGNVRTDSRKRERDSCADKTSEKESGKVNYENGCDLSQSKVSDHPTRRSMRQKEQVSYREEVSNYCDDDFLDTLKKRKASVAKVGESSAQENPNGPVASGEKSDEKPTEPADGSTSDVNEAASPEMVECPEAEFSNFDKDKQENCFAVNQVWAIYDTTDCMPRFYARVRKVFSPGFKLKITWFEADPEENDQDEVEWCNEDLPVACGRYTLGHTQETEDRDMFSHQIKNINTKKSGFMVYPRKGETWALFRNWDIKWSTEPEQHVPFKYEFVEVLSDFVEGNGITVAYLNKVKGFVCLFQRLHAESFQIPRKELYRFSHSIPSFRMTGRERKDVPEGSLELDPAALPSEVTAPCAENLPEDNISCSHGSDSSTFNDNAQQPGLASMEKISSPRRTGKHNLGGEPSLVRRSPRGSSKQPQTENNSAQKNIGSSSGDKPNRAYMGSS